MHLGNSTLTPMCAVYGATAAGAGLAMGVKLARGAARPDPLHFAAACAFVFVAQAFNLPIWPGVSGHLIGGVLLAYLFGSAWGLFGMSLVLATQSLLFADGGWVALGLNVFNMGVIPCLIVWPMLKLRHVAIVAWTSVVAASTLCGLQLLTVVSTAQQGVSAIMALVGAHALIGLLEAAITVTAIEAARWLARQQSSTRLLVGAAIPPAVALFAVWGASPWPDALEHTITLHSIQPAVNSALDQIERWQSAIARDYTLTGLMLGTAVVAVASAVSCLKKTRRTTW